MPVSALSAFAIASSRDSDGVVLGTNAPAYVRIDVERHESTV